MPTDDIKGFELSDNWTLETSDHATVFVQYRGIDVIAIWTPFDAPASGASVTIPSPDQIHGMRRETAVNFDPDMPQTEWSQLGEIAIDLTAVCNAINQFHDERDRVVAVLAENPIEDWRYEVANGDTQRGYRDWLAARSERT